MTGDTTYRPASATLNDLVAKHVSARELLDGQLRRHDTVHYWTSPWARNERLTGLRPNL